MRPQDLPRKETRDFIDYFHDDCVPGGVVGRANADGVVRKGNDVERVISIDNGALRIQPLLKPGWGRAGIAYGPYKRANGLTFAVFILNGHNTSQVGNLMQSLVRRIGRWAKGSETNSITDRMLHLLLRGNKRRLVREVRRWAWLNRQPPEGSGGLDENLAVGWFGRAVPADPLVEGNAFVMHAAGAENGELWVNASDRPLPALRGVQNIPIYYVVVLRERGAAYYAASLADAHGLGELPSLRPLAIDACHDEEIVYAGLYQSVLGQIGFRVDSRVYSAEVARINSLNTWYGTAHAADRLSGSGSLIDTPADVGGAWVLHAGMFERTQHGATPRDRDSLAVLDPGTPAGLIHVLVRSTADDTSASIIWRFKDKENYWCLNVSRHACTLALTIEGRSADLAAAEGNFLQTNKANAVQILDNGDTIELCLNSCRLFGASIADTRLSEATGVGLRSAVAPEGELFYSHVEAHPRIVPCPERLKLPTPWREQGDHVHVRDHFIGPIGTLGGRETPTGEAWERVIGSGQFEVSGESSVKVRASVRDPNPGRTAYTVPWTASEFADVVVTMTPPGDGRGHGENGRSGLVFWQDADNYIVINSWLEDTYKGASISSFFHLNGFEEIYDAVWTNVGARIVWGRPYHLRVVFDGVRYIAYINDEPVLFRALTDVYPNLPRLAINRVGIAANWEWGNDTGTTFTDFIARSKGTPI